MLPASLLLPDAMYLQLTSVAVDAATHVLTLEVAATATSVCCPTCHQPTTRIHSHYYRTIADLPIAGWRVRLHVAVRKFRCPNRVCPQRVFCERLSTVTAAWARRTLRLADAQRAIGLALGGAAGARLAAKLTLPSARDTLLTLVRRSSRVPHAAPTRVGIDDWAWRKGQTYATIIIDLDTHRPLALLPDRSPAGVAAWLHAHPGITVVSRDRWNGYAEGITQGAPTAIQVADRFHLLQNLGATLLRVLQSHQRAIERHMKVAQATGVPAAPPIPHITRRVREQTVRAERWRARVAQVHQLHADGWLQRAIATHLGLHPRTIRRYLRHDPATAERVRRRQQRLLDPYQAYLVERWNGGCRTAVQLFREIQAQGYQGQLTRVRDYLATLRHAQGIPPYVRALPPGISPVHIPAKPPTMRQLAGLVLKPVAHAAPEPVLLAQVRDAHPDIDRSVTLAQDFATIVRERQVTHLDAWLDRAMVSGIQALQNFATGLRQDAAAVTAALRLPYSNGPTEGQINRLKLLKRQGYGRAKLDLLECRLLAE